MLYFDSRDCGDGERKERERLKGKIIKTRDKLRSEFYIII